MTLQELQADPRLHYEAPEWVRRALKSALRSDPVDVANWMDTLADAADGSLKCALQTQPCKSTAVR